jgi:hypothetical protein
MNTVKSLLSQLYGTTDEVRKDIESQLKKHFIDPFYVGRSPALHEKDILKADARIVSDAFEAVTNGMYDSEILTELEKIDENSFFADWKYLTEALYHMYSENFKEADRVFRKINQDSIPALISPVFYRIISRDKISSITELSDSEKQFINSIIKDSLSVKNSLEQIENNLKAEHEDRFVDNITLLLSDLYTKDQNLSKKLAAWALKQLSLYDMSPSLFLENLKLIFGDSESYRLTALAFRDEDPELSLVFFTKTALTLLRNNSADKLKTEVYIEIICELLIDIEKEKSDDDSDSDDEMTEQINNILIVLERELSLHFPDILAGESIRFKAFNLDNGLPDSKNTETGIQEKINKAAENIISAHTKSTDNKNPADSSDNPEETSDNPEETSDKPDVIVVNPVQLELFF